jgi:hypothetical protein
VSANGQATADQGVTDSPDHTAGDPDVLVAFRLGWHVAQLYHDGAVGRHSGELSEPEGTLPEALPGASSLTPAAQAQMVFREIQAERHLLTKPCQPADVTLPDLGAVDNALKETRRDVKLQVLALHKALLTNLTAADFRFGKAYDLGRALAETVLLPDSERREAYASQLEAQRVATLCNSLDDLSSAFPPHAARAVGETLRKWRDWVDLHQGAILGAVAAQGGKELTRALRDQGRLWRALLSGEKRPGDLLEAQHYVSAATNLGKNTWRGWSDAFFWGGGCLSSPSSP